MWMWEQMMKLYAPYINQSTPKKKKNKEQNGRTHIQEDKWTTQEGKPQGEHQVPEPPPVGRSISNKEN